MTDLDPKLDDAAVRQVLERALELEGERAGTLTVEQVREIASELGIPKSAVDQALAEYRGATAAGPTGMQAPPSAPHSVEKRLRVARALMVSMALVGGASLLMILMTLLIRL